MQFIVERDGSLTDIRVLRDPGYGFGKAAVKVISEMHKWLPGKQKNKVVRSQYTLPISIYKLDAMKYLVGTKVKEGDKRFIGEPYYEEGICKFVERFKELYLIKMENKEMKLSLDIEFAVELDGSVKYIKAVNSITQEADEEAIKIVKSLGTWIPGKCEGKEAIVRKFLTIQF